MSVLLLSSSFVTTLLIPAEAFAARRAGRWSRAGVPGARVSRHGFGTLYDIATIAILWFAGASAMAGLLNLIPRYLPRYGMAPEWARAQRPLVTIITGITILVTVIFNANVDAQGGAYATGVLVLMSSGAVAVATMAWREKRHRAGIHGDRPGLPLHDHHEYLRAAGRHQDCVDLHPDDRRNVADLARIALDRVARARAWRPTAMRSGSSRKRPKPGRFGSSPTGPIRAPTRSIRTSLREARETHYLPNDDADLFLEVRPGDVSEFSDILEVRGGAVNGFRVLRCQSPAIPNAIAALLLYIRDTTGQIPHAYFGWTEGNPITYLLKFLAFGEGDTAPVTREVLRQAEKDPLRRPTHPRRLERATCWHERVERLKARFDVFEMDPQQAAAARGEHLEIAARLRQLDRPEAVALSRHRQYPPRSSQVICRNTPVFGPPLCACPVECRNRGPKPTVVATLPPIAH